MLRCQGEWESQKYTRAPCDSVIPRCLASIGAAAREVGVSRTAGHNWARGYKTLRGDQVAGFVPAVERLAVRQTSRRFLSQDQRIEIADLQFQGLSIREIGRRLGRVS